MTIMKTLCLIFIYRYLSRWRVEYKIGNDERNLVYIDINSLHIRGKTCMDMDRSKK